MATIPGGVLLTLKAEVLLNWRLDVLGLYIRQQ